MAAVIVSDYFYGDESKEFSYFRIPRLLITHQRFKNISVEAKLLYGLLLDRMGLSEEHGWYDEDGRVFIYYTVEEIADDLCCGRDKAMKLLAELDKTKGAGLIERVRQGQGKPTKIYVKRFTTREVPPKKEEIPAPISEVEILDVQKSEIPTSRGRKIRLIVVEKSELQKSEKPTLIILIIIILILVILTEVILILSIFQILPNSSQWI